MNNCLGVLIKQFSEAAQCRKESVPQVMAQCDLESTPLSAVCTFELFKPNEKGAGFRRPLIYRTYSSLCSPPERQRQLLVEHAGVVDWSGALALEQRPALAEGELHAAINLEVVDIK